MPITIREFSLPDRADDPTWAARGVLVRAYDHELIGTTEWDVDDALSLSLAKSNTTDSVYRLIAFDGDRLIGFANVYVNDRDSPDMGNYLVYVDADHRRQGVGTALIERLDAHAAERGLTRLTAWVLSPMAGDEPVVVPETGVGRAPANYSGMRFALRNGFVLEQVERVSRYDFAAPAVAPGDALAEATAAAGDDYELIAWEGPAPDDIVGGLVTLKERMATDPPSGGMDVVVATWDVARLRELEDRFLPGHRMWRTVVRHRPSGEIVALNELLRSTTNPEALVDQWDTIVLPEHRGHRLGMLVKAANLIQVRDGDPAARSIVTWNAEENRYMLAVNEALGFRPILIEGAMQKRL